jgi:hypothetical protein
MAPNNTARNEARSTVRSSQNLEETSLSNGIAFTVKRYSKQKLDMGLLRAPPQHVLPPLVVVIIVASA